MRKLFILVFVAFLVLLVAYYMYEPELSSLSYASGNEDSARINQTVANSPKSIKALFICRDHPLLREDAIVWQEVLGEYGIDVTINLKSELSSSSFYGMDIIIVGTGRVDRRRFVSTEVWEGVYRDTKVKPDPNLGPDSWEETTIVKMLSEADLPIIGIGESGYSLFHELGFPTNSSLRSYNHSADLSFVLTEDSRKYLREPFIIDGGGIALVNGGDDVSSHYFPPPSMEYILEDVNKPGFCPLVRYQQYVSWYCGRDPRYLPEIGRKLFANIAYTLVRDKRIKSNADRVSALQELNYNNALEFYDLFRVKRLKLRDMEAKVESGSFSVEDLRLYVKAKRLQGFQNDWRLETPDSVVSKKDREEIDKIVYRFFPDRAVRRKWERVDIKFYGGNRCHVDILFYNRGPLNAAGSNLFLIKNEGRWAVLRSGGWIS